MIGSIINVCRVSDAQGPLCAWLTGLFKTFVTYRGLSTETKFNHGDYKRKDADDHTV